MRRFSLASGVFAAVAGIVHAQLPPGCEGRTQIANRLVVFCAYSGCNNQPSLGFEYKAVCQSWCCPNGTIGIDMTSCIGAYQTGACCPPTLGPYTPGFTCAGNGS